MGVDCTLTIPAPAKLRDVADTIAALLGAPRGLCAISYHTMDDLPECVRIELGSPINFSVLYHYEWDKDGNHGIMPRATARNIALCVALCDFFGGSVDFNDCDNTDQDYAVPFKSDLHESAGDPWEAFQERRVSVLPLTRKQIDQYESIAAYKS